MNELQGKTAVITGGAGGIGLAAVWLFAREGCTGIAISDIRPDGPDDAIKAIQSETGCRCVYIKTDVSDSTSVAGLFEKILAEFGTVDCLVNCAGICRVTPLPLLTDQEWDTVLGVNLKGTLLCSKAAMEIMKKNQSGRIVTMSSISGRVGGIRTSASYVASKGGITALTKYLAKDGAPFGITVNSVAPGVIDTDMTKDFVFSVSEVPLGRKGTALEVANVLMFLCSDRSSYVTGVTIDINGGSFM